MEQKSFSIKDCTILMEFGRGRGLGCIENLRTQKNFSHKRVRNLQSNVSWFTVTEAIQMETVPGTLA